MPIFARCKFDQPRPLVGKNSPVNISLTHTIVTTDVIHSGLGFPLFSIEFYYADTMVCEWIFASEQDRNSEFERILSI